jgi:hypothetical protein
MIWSGGQACLYDATLSPERMWMFAVFDFPAVSELADQLPEPLT